MADASSFGPSVFTGSGFQDPLNWRSSLENYIEYKGIDDISKKVALFKLRLADSARDWLTTLPADKKDTFAHLLAAFLDRFQPRELEKYRFAKDLFNQKQLEGQSVDTFVTDLKKKAVLVGMDAKSQVWAALNGLLPPISAYVLEHSPESLDDVLRHARVAEMTRCSIGTPDDRVSKQLEQLAQQMTVLNNRMSVMTTSAVEDRKNDISPSHHVSFRDRRSRSPSPYGTAENQNRTPPRTPDAVRRKECTQPYEFRRPQNWPPRNTSQYRDQPARFFNHSGQTSTGQTMREQLGCSRCGLRSGHANPLYCAMINKECYTCGKKGHSFRVCRSSKQY